MNDTRIPTGEELAIKAMEKDLKRLSIAADKAKAACDEYCSTGSELIAIHEEFSKILNSGKHGQREIAKLARLQARQEKVSKINKKDFMKLMDRQSRAEIMRSNLGSVIEILKIRFGLGDL